MNTFTYHIGHLGVDDGEQILILTQAACDWGPFQMDNPKEINNITVHTTDLRDWWHGSNRSMPTRDPGGGRIGITVRNGYLKEGGEVFVTRGDQSGLDCFSKMGLWPGRV